MKDIIVTTFKHEMQNAALETADAIAAHARGERTEYFRRLGTNSRPIGVLHGDRIFYVEDGYVRGYALIDRVAGIFGRKRVRLTTNEIYPSGFYVFMKADTWKWIQPIPMRGFQGWRYSRLNEERIVIVGGWLDPRPLYAYDAITGSFVRR